MNPVGARGWTKAGTGQSEMADRNSKRESAGPGRVRRKRKTTMTTILKHGLPTLAESTPRFVRMKLKKCGKEPLPPVVSPPVRRFEDKCLRPALARKAQNAPVGNRAYLRALRAAEMAVWQDPTQTVSSGTGFRAKSTSARLLQPRDESSRNVEMRLFIVVAACTGVAILNSFSSFSGLLRHWPAAFIEFVQRALF
jgi:hypothetical protein